MIDTTTKEFLHVCLFQTRTTERILLFLRELQEKYDREQELRYDQQAWSVKLLLTHIKEEYGVEYHENYVYELLREAGLSLLTGRLQHHEADPEETAELQETVEKMTQTERENHRCR